MESESCFSTVINKDKKVPVKDAGFRIGSNGRPEGTAETDKGVLHYTCNSPNEEVLKQMGIMQLGAMFDISPNEVLLIPPELFERAGKKVSTIEAEALLRNLSKKSK